MYNRLIVKSLFPVVVNLLMSYVCYAICRIAFFCENWDAFICDINLGVLWRMTCGAISFDTSAVKGVTAIYDYVKDPLLKNDIHRNVNIPERYRMEQLIKAILQSYNERMSRNEMSL